MTDDTTRVDPRYDPAFQRGFDGPVVTGQRRRPASRPEQQRDATTPARVEERLDATRPETPAPRSEQAHVETPEDQVHDDHEPAQPRRLTRNPFLITLVVLGAALTVGGLAWANQARMLVSVRGGAATDLDYWFLQSSAVAAPLTILAGVGILAGVLFIAASAWNRRA